jgi:hypothetical protein
MRCSLVAIAVSGCASAPVPPLMTLADDAEPQPDTNHALVVFVHHHVPRPGECADDGTCNPGNTRDRVAHVFVDHGAFVGDSLVDSRFVVATTAGGHVFVALVGAASTGLRVRVEAGRIYYIDVLASENGCVRRGGGHAGTWYSCDDFIALRGVHRRDLIDPARVVRGTRRLVADVDAGAWRFAGDHAIDARVRSTSDTDWDEGSLDERDGF